jgi:hypothetical protein
MSAVIIQRYNALLMSLHQVFPDRSAAELRAVIRECFNSTTSPRQWPDSMASQLLSRSALKGKMEDVKKTFETDLSRDDLFRFSDYHEQAQWLLSRAFPSLHVRLVGFLYRRSISKDTTIQCCEVERGMELCTIANEAQHVVGDPSSNRTAESDDRSNDGHDTAVHDSGKNEAFGKHQSTQCGNRGSVKTRAQIKTKSAVPPQLVRVWQQCQHIDSFTLIRWMSNLFSSPSSSSSHWNPPSEWLSTVSPCKSASAHQRIQWLRHVIDTIHDLDPLLLGDLVGLLRRISRQPGYFKMTSSSDDAVECSCCCTDVVWDQIVSCTDGHLLCHLCIRRYIGEQMFGSLVRHDAIGGGATIPCIAATAGIHGASCTGFVTESFVQLAVMEDGTWDQWLTWTTRRALDLSGCPKVQCASCGYAVFYTESDKERVYSALKSKRSNGDSGWWLKYFPIGPLSVAGVLILPQMYIFYAMGIVCLVTLIYFAVRRKANCKPQTFPFPSFRFHCPQCEKATCTACQQPWIGFHSTCSVSHRLTETETRERLKREHLKTMAIVRQCHHCKVSYDLCHKLNFFFQVRLIAIS